MRPSCNLEHNDTTTPALPVDGFPNAHSTPPSAPVKAMWDYEVAELAWENGQLVTHGFGFHRTVAQPSTTKYAWDNPLVGGTLESVVNQATCPRPPGCGAGEHLPLFRRDNATVDADMDALVACSNVTLPPSTGENPARLCPPGIGSSTACSGAVFGGAATKRTRTSKEMSSRRESWHVTMENTCDIDLDAGFTWASQTSLGKPLSGQSMPTTLDDHDSVGCRPQAQARAQVKMKRESTEENGSEDGKKKAKMEISSVSTKSSRARAAAAAAAVHNQSERRRRDKINQRMETLQKLIPNSSKTDKASVLDEVIVYLKQLQAQLQMMSSFPQMMVPMTTTMQQLQMSMLAQMGMGMGMSAMDINSMNRLGSAAAVPPMLHQGILLPLPASWDGSVDRLPPSAGAVLPDPFSTLLSRQTMPPQQRQPMTLDAYNRMMALYQQPHPRTAPGGNAEGLI